MSENRRLEEIIEGSSPLVRRARRRGRNFIPPRHARRTQAQIETIRYEALDDEQAELATNDLRTRGYCLMRNGRRYDPPKPTPPKVIFDEQPLDKTS